MYTVIITNADGEVVETYKIHDDEVGLIKADIAPYDCDPFCLHTAHRDEVSA